MFSKLPSLFFGTGYASNGTNMTLPIAGFSELTSAEADASTGDSRKVLYAVLDKVNKAVAALPDADKPTRLVVSRSATSPNAQNEFQVTFAVSFTLSAAGADVADE